MTLIAACGGGSSRGDLPPYVVSELQTASPFERSILEDGTVTAPEYEQAVLATLSCLDAQGVPHGDASFNQQSNRWEYQLGPWPKEQDDQFQGKYNDCFNDSEQAVAAVWADQTRPPTQKEFDEMQAKIVACLNEHGLHADDYKTFVEHQGDLNSAEMEIALNCKTLGYTGVDNFK